MKTITDPTQILSQCADLLSDESKYRLGTPLAVYYPQSVDDIRFIMTEAAKLRIAVTIMGGKTGITGASVPVDGCYAICVSEMNRIVRVDCPPGSSPLLTCEPGVTLAAIDQFLNDPTTLTPPPCGSENLQAKIWFYPPDPTEMTAQLGGTIATNASGARSYAFGATRGHIEAITVVLPTGDTATISRTHSYTRDKEFSLSTDQGNTITIPRPKYSSPTVKNASGYYSQPDMHLIDLFIGSEGTLGIITQASLRLTPRPDIVSGLTFLPSRPCAFALADFLRSSSSVLAIEYFDESALRFMNSRRDNMNQNIPAFPEKTTCAVYWEFNQTAQTPFVNIIDTWEQSFKACGTSFEQTWSGFEPDELVRLKAFRHALPELINNQIAQNKAQCPGIRKISTDAAVPGPEFTRFISESIALIEAEKLDYVCFGHLGDYHLHINIIPAGLEQMQRAEATYKKIMNRAIAAKGSVSAEHGIGKLKREYLALMYGPALINEMKLIKSAIDPDWILNPGNLFLRD